MYVVVVTCPDRIAAFVAGGQEPGVARPGNDSGARTSATGLDVLDRLLLSVDPTLHVEVVEQQIAPVPEQLDRSSPTKTD